MQVTIASLGYRGEGVALVGEGRLFVPYTLPGEVADIAVQGDRGHVEHLLRPSPQRVDAFCKHFGICGGCALQHIDAAAYAQFKRGLIETPLKRAGIDAPIAPLVIAHGEGRRRATLHARKEGAGFMQARTHQVHNLDQCPITVRQLAKAPAIARAVFGAIGEADVSVTATLGGIDVAVRVDRKRERPERLAPLLARGGLARIALNGEIVLQAQSPTIRMGKAEMRLPIASFLQATAEAEHTLAALAIAAIGPAKRVADLFCGVGPFALRLAERLPVFAIDSDKPAIAALGAAVRNTSGLKRIEAKARDLFREPLTRYELDGFDAVLFDPPRAGAQAQARELAGSKVKTVVAVSCDPQSFTRDAEILLGGGYRLEGVTPVDQFAYSPHLELVGVFRRPKG